MTSAARTNATADPAARGYAIRRDPTVAAGVAADGRVVIARRRYV